MIDWQVNKFNWFIILLSVPILSSCWWSGSDSDKNQEFFVKVDRTSSLIEVELPSSLWNELEEIGAIIYTNMEGQKVKYYTDKTFLPFKVRLRELSDRVLGGNNYEVTLGEGGGFLDLSDFVVGKEGEFQLEVVVPETFPLSNIYVFYLSNARRKSLGNDIVGAGCKVFLDITSFYRKSMKTGGLKLNAKDLRYAYLTTGTFFIAVLNEQKLHLSHLSVGDSRYPETSCSSKTKK